MTMFASSKSSIKALSVVLALSALASGCSFNKKNVETKIKNSEVLLDESRKQLSEQSAARITAEDVKISFIGQADANDYLMRIEWPESVPAMQVEVGDGGTIQVKDASSIDLPVSGGADVKLKLKSKTKDGLVISSFEVDKKVPKDYQFSGIVRLNSDLTIDADYNRIMFATDSVVFTDGNKLVLIGNEIVFGLNSKISTMSAETQKLKFSNLNLLENGPYIEMNAKSARGMIFIYLIGANGADGRSSLDLAFEAYNQDIRKPAPAGGVGAPGELTTTRCSGKGDFQRCTDVCVGATNGQNGADGLKAPDAEDGYMGGRPGHLKVLIEDYSKAAFRIYQKAGLPGKGGQGHASQVGGKGGPVHPQTCSDRVRAGADGITLPAGEEGRSGQEAQPAILEVPRDPGIFMVQQLTESNDPFRVFATK